MTTLGQRLAIGFQLTASQHHGNTAWLLLARSVAAWTTDDREDAVQCGFTRYRPLRSCTNRREHDDGGFGRVEARRSIRNRRCASVARGGRGGGIGPACVLRENA